MAGGDAGIVEAAHLLRHVGQVDGHLVAFDLNADLDGNRRADIHAVIVHEGLRFIDAVGNGERARARRRFGLVHDGGNGVQHRLRP